MYKDIFESIRNEAEKRNLRERTIQLYCSDVSYFLRWIGKNVSDLTLEDAESFLFQLSWHTLQKTNICHNTKRCIKPTIKYNQS